MSELWLCQRLAEESFYLEIEQIEIYSMEELCYYLYWNIELVDEQLINLSLAAWLEEALGFGVLAKELRQELKAGSSALQCAWMLLNRSGLYTQKELASFKRNCENLLNMSEFEYQKCKADKSLENNRLEYSLKIYENLLLLGSKEGRAREELAKICNNCGTAYARLFLFAEAADAFERAYMLDARQEYIMAQRQAEELLHSKKIQEMSYDIPEDWEVFFKTQKEEYMKKVM